MADGISPEIRHRFSELASAEAAAAYREYLNRVIRLIEGQIGGELDKETKTGLEIVLVAAYNKGLRPEEDAKICLS